MKLIKNFRAALGFLSLFPIGRRDLLEEEDFGRFPSVFPLVGLFLGLLLLAFWLLADLILPAGVLSLAEVALLIFLNRGFHLDGLADTADALLSHKSREQKLAIMKDSRQGTFGVLAIVLAVLLKIEFLQALITAPEPWPLPALLILWPVWGRLAASVTAVCSPYVRSEGGLGRFIVERSRPSDLGQAIIISLAISLPFGWAALAGLLAMLGFALLLTGLWRLTLGGLTGDLLGASVELGEIFALFLLIIIHQG